jgi:hypothetical protein
VSFGLMFGGSRTGGKPGAGSGTIVFAPRLPFDGRGTAAGGSGGEACAAASA